MISLVLLSLAAGQFPVVEAKSYPASLQEKALAATVRILNVTGNAEGTGVIVEARGPFVHVLTAGHIIRDGEEIEVSFFAPDTFPKPKKVYTDVKVMAQSQGVKDLALLRVYVSEKAPAPLPLRAKARELNLKNFAVLTVGCSGGAAPTCRIETIESAKVLGRTAGGETGKLWELKSAQVKGRSGGPMLDTKGRIIGICSGNNAGRGYFCHVAEIEDFLVRHQFRYLLDDAR